MKKSLSIFAITLFSSFFCFAQVQIGSDIDGDAAGDQFGHSVCVSGDGTTIAVGAPFNDGGGTDAGHVRVYKNISGSWTQLGNDIIGEDLGDESGFSVSMSDDGLTVAIGARYNTNTSITNSLDGHVRVYKFISGNWVQQGADIDAEISADRFGWSVSLSDDGLTLAIGAPYNDGNGISSGHVRVFKFISGTWLQQGADIDGESAGDLSGLSVSLNSDGSILAIGAPYNDGNVTDAGHVRVYTFISGTWVQQGADINGESAADQSGYSVSLSDDGLIVAVGARWNDGNGNIAGHARVYKFELGSWVQIGSDIDGESAGDLSGFAVSLSGDGLTVAIGAYANDGGGSDAGHVRVYKYTSNVWVKEGVDIDGEFIDDWSGYSVSISDDGSVVIVGAIYNDGGGSNSGHVRIYKFCNNPIAAPNLSGNTITATQAGATYQWLDCDNGNAVIANETNQSYTPTANGNYAVEVDLNGCVDTSACVAITTVGITENDPNSNIRIYPNPVINQLTIENLGDGEPLTVRIFNLQGQLLAEITNDAKQTLINVDFDFPSGSYLVQVLGNQSMLNEMIVKN